MSNFMMNLISWILLLLVILTLYLIDKVNKLTTLQEEALHPSEPVPALPEPEPPSDILFAGLEGKTLWDAMSGKQIEGFEPSLIEALRPHYEPILREHIETTFKDGLEDAEETDPQNPGSLRTIATPRGEVESWLPPQHLGSIYRTAMEFGSDYARTRDVDTFYRLQETLDSVTQMLYQRAGLTLEIPFSETLLDVASLPSVPAPAPEDEVLALTDAREATDESAMQEALTPESSETNLAQGLEQVQQYEEQQRQDLAAEQASEVLEPVMPLAQPDAVAQDVLPQEQPADKVTSA
ncbi:MAG: hypothetical protein RLZZ24_538 [Pseudomonadota bacterium]|jgi:hypothetical protein